MPDSPNPNPPLQRPRLTDVAKLCGVSAATVSRVLNRDSNFSARPEVRQRILDAAAEIGYAPDLTARNLIRGKSQILGVFGSPHTHIGEGINDEVFVGIADAVHSLDYDVFFELTSHHAHGQGQALPAWRFDGAILIQSPAEELVASLEQRRIPYVAVNETIGQPVASVLADDVGGTLQAIEHLAGLGHERIAYTNTMSGYFPHYSSRDRHQTLVAYCRSHGLTLVPGHDEFFVSGDRFLRDSVQKHGATAAICYDHRIAIALLGAAYRAQIRIPEQLSLLCFNDLFPVADVYPALTAVAVTGQDMGRTAVRLLLDRLDGKSMPGQTQTIQLPERLVVRASTAAPPPK